MNSIHQFLKDNFLESETMHSLSSLCFWTLDLTTLTILVTISESLNNLQSLAPLRVCTLHAIHCDNFLIVCSYIAISSSCPAAQASLTEDVLAGLVPSLDYFCTLIFMSYLVYKIWTSII